MVDNNLLVLSPWVPNLVDWSWCPIQWTFGFKYIDSHPMFTLKIWLRKYGSPHLNVCKYSCVKERTKGIGSFTWDCKLILWTLFADACEFRSRVKGSLLESSYISACPKIASSARGLIITDRIVLGFLMVIPKWSNPGTVPGWKPLIWMPVWNGRTYRRQGMELTLMLVLTLPRHPFPTRTQLLELPNVIAPPLGRNCKTPPL